MQSRACKKLTCPLPPICQTQILRLTALAQFLPSRLPPFGKTLIADRTKTDTTDDPVTAAATFSAQIQSLGQPHVVKYLRASSIKVRGNTEGLLILSAAMSWALNLFLTPRVGSLYAPMAAPSVLHPITV